MVRWSGRDDAEYGGGGDVTGLQLSGFIGADSRRAAAAPRTIQRRRRRSRRRRCRRRRRSSVDIYQIER